MKVWEIEKNVIVYSISTHSQTRLGLNIVALINGEKALLIDAGYEEEAKLVKEDLNTRGIKVVAVIPTHFHPDHVEGIKVLDRPQVYGNQFAINTMKRFNKDGIDKMLPTTIIDDQSQVEFGSFKLQFEHAPGHSECSVLIMINNQYIHLGDLYLRTDAGGEVLPYVTWKGVLKHLESFEKILKHKTHIPLISHGLMPRDQEDLRIGIEDRKIYLNALLTKKNRLLAKEATKNCSRPFEILSWRKDV